MLMDRDYELNIQRIIKLVNVDRDFAEKLYNESGTDIEKIYNALKKIRVSTHLHTHCIRCGKPLKSKDSQILGYGKVCGLKRVQHKIKKLNLVGDTYVESRAKRTC